MSNSQNGFPPIGILPVFMRLRRRSPRAFAAVLVVSSAVLLAGGLAMLIA